MEKTYEGYSYELITKDGEDLWKITQGTEEYYFSVIDYGIDEAIEEIEEEKK